MTDLQFVHRALGIALLAIGFLAFLIGITLIRREKRMRRGRRKSVHRELSRLDDRIFELEKEQIERNAVVLDTDNKEKQQP